jgi:hypothetical protein
MNEKDEAREMTVDLRGPDVTVHLQGAELNVSPHAFHINAEHYYKCKQDFVPPDDYPSSLPYFLLCRAIELELKARLLRYWRQSHVKREFSHNLLDAYKVVEAYNALDAQEQILSQSELAILTEADAIYSRKGFEYFVPTDALTAYSRYPDLEMLDAIAKKLIDSGPTKWE